MISCIIHKVKVHANIESMIIFFTEFENHGNKWEHEIIIKMEQWNFGICVFIRVSKNNVDNYENQKFHAHNESIFPPSCGNEKSW